MTVRMPKGLREVARKALSARDRKLGDFVVACMNALRENPDDLLERLAPHWPEPNRRGRPPKRRS
ncbi:hypothetical protein B7435_23870 [Mycolicibacterium peregrinum]|nr:hypothetical protein B7435_23870 [Mycolicibacterium peregrinum]